MPVAVEHTLVDAVDSIEDVSSRIEDAFARVGHQLGRGHIIFKELNQSLAALSVEIAGTELEGAANALQEIAARLNEFAQVLPTEGALLETIRNHTLEASSLLKPLFKHIQMITIIARSAKIEAASLDGDREGFLAFTGEAHDIGMAVQRLIEACASDQQRLWDAVATASSRQKEFAARYGGQLVSGSAELASAYSGLSEQRGQSTHLAELASASTRKVAEAVGSAIISLQAGDSARQRLEHICHGLRLVTGAEQKFASDAVTGSAGIDGERAICQLQAAQLKDVQREFDGDIGNIVQSLSAVLRDSNGIVSQGRSLFAGGGGTSSSSRLARIKETLAQASTLIASCENAGRSVDDALRIVEDTLAKFREAISGLAEAVVDITLIGMNAGLKAGHLGARGSAFVVIANELKTTADQVAVGASRLRPVLDNIEQPALKLKRLRVHGDRTQLARLEPQILQALREVEAGNDRLGKLIGRLGSDSAEFEGLMDSAQTLTAEVRHNSANLAVVATRLEAAGGTPQKPLLAADQAALDELFARYTMEREREVHREFLQQAGVVSVVAMQPAPSASIDDGVLLF